MGVHYNEAVELDADAEPDAEPDDAKEKMQIVM